MAVGDPFKRGLAWDFIRMRGLTSSGDIVEELDISLANASKLLGEMFASGHLNRTPRIRAGHHLYTVNPDSLRPVDHRQKSAKPGHEDRAGGVRQWSPRKMDQPAILLQQAWTYFPMGTEARYCVRIDTQRGEVPPEFSMAAD